MAHRGYLTAFYAKTGRLAWRWYAVPGPGEPGHDTWKGDSWRFGGGAPWMTGSFDPQPNLLYWGTGNPSPAYFDAVRLPGDGNRKNANLYTDCIVALDPDTGKLRWYYQELPGDVTDFDSAYEIILTDREVNGRPRKLLVHMNKSGVTFVLDRVSGEFVNAFSVAEVQNWISGVGKEGELAGRRHPDVNKSTNLCPSIAGAKSWNQMAFSPRTGLIYTPVIEICVEVTPNDQAPDEGGPYLNAAIELKLPPNRTTYSHVDAWDPVTGKRIWSYAYRYLLMASVLATAGDLVFTGDPEGDFFALDAKTGEKLWSYQTGAGHRGSAPCFRNLVARPRGYGPGQDNPWRPKLHFRQSAYLADAYGNTAGSQRALPKAD
jgi:alcohol dehydrogenase (cytochrome c)